MYNQLTFSSMEVIKIEINGKEIDLPVDSTVTITLTASAKRSSETPNMPAPKKPQGA